MKKFVKTVAIVLVVDYDADGSCRLQQQQGE